MFRSPEAITCRSQFLSMLYPVRVRIGVESPFQPSGVWATRERMRQAEKQLAAQAEASYKRSIADWKAASPKNEKAGASVTAGRA